MTVGGGPPARSFGCATGGPQGCGMRRSPFRGGSQMRDPDMVTRAQRAAVALERAWERWRAMHGLSADPMPPVCSYVGYSIEEPWGRPRVVFGVDAREAELLAALLDHHECVGPFYQEPSSGPAYGTGAPG